MADLPAKRPQCFHRYDADIKAAAVNPELTLWERACPAIGPAGPVKAATAVCMTHRDYRFYDGFAADRGTSPLPQGPAIQGRGPGVPS